MVIGIAAGASKSFTGVFQWDRAVFNSFVGLGEEGLYRGFLFPAFADVFSSKFLGAFVSSALFGLAHTQYGGIGRLTVGITGLLWCWEESHNNFDPRKNMFSHAWYDFFLSPAVFGGKETSLTLPVPGVRGGFRF
ncbi:MAG: CPBP family intramembrane metalloprotease [Deltaproteobacteria bacterium]|nr:CPBP family intramembrane metalloprotease [Deltaproteobacteria bacterium]